MVIVKEMKTIFSLVAEIENIFEKMDKANADIWRLTIAANLMHDVDDKIRETFLNNYEELRDEIKKIYG